MTIRGILLDIEGTTSSVRFVYDVLFPYAKTHAAEFLDRRWGTPEVAAACELICQNAGWCSFDMAAILKEVDRLMAADAKATGLKALQGLIWEEGYARGELKSHVYPDVPPALEKWTTAGLDVRIYSSGSVAAQKSFFKNTELGDLLGFFRGHYDTTTGGKREAPSYTRIASDMGLSPGQVLFLSDVPAELDAAALAGMRTGLLIRPGNAPVGDGPHARYMTFEQIPV